MSAFLRQRLDPQERAGLRFTLLVGALVVLALLVLPLGVLVRDEWDPLTALDERVSAAAVSATRDSAALRAAALGFTHLGAPLLIYALAGVLAVVLLRVGRRRSALLLALAVAGAYLLSTTGKLVVGRDRPSFPDPISMAQGASFPSGHATGSAAFYAALAVVLLPVLRDRWRRALVAAAVLIPIGVAATRVLLGVHYASDVTAGLLLGWGWAVACTAVFATWRHEEGRRGSTWRRGVEPGP